MDELEPVDESESVYRRIHPRYYDLSLPTPVQFEAFRPTRNDTTGVSVFRARFAGPKDTLPADAAKAAGYYVAALAVRELAKLGLSLRPDPLPAGPPGHCVIAELTWEAYEKRKQHWKPILFELAKLASTNIVHQPGQAP